MAATQSTDDKILTAFSELLFSNGYEGTTTKKIAEQAGVNESTIFRHFQDKHGILTKLIEGYMADINNISDSFEIKGDIVQDLMRVAKTYDQFIENHKSLFLLGLRNGYQFPEIISAIKQLPTHLKAVLIEKFTGMVKTGELDKDVDLDTAATNFILLNFGNAVFKYAYPNAGLYVPMSKFTKENIKEFAEKLKS
ncbi:TetR/AcrR family transcriptional regulator [Lentilactobacillus sunkii]|uniref:Transcriptional regulator n=1 Tax=Lentilactobacillus sunkii DSM 19904 TaxID=1423808 RepID=A0A0R1KYB0_9LACO|nr:TetR/AcrR family transcriptional regulator [Lentilactobacillus sunkii]KRK88304.1 transcriptional regulator [Lentilactobacillus sunkii DSM 19904]